MSEHASALDLDEAAAGLAPASVHKHIEGCASCSSRLAEVTNSRNRIGAFPEFRQTLEKLPKISSPPRNRWLVLTAAAASLAAAAALLITVRPAHLRAKGSSALELVTTHGDEASSPRVGDELELKIAGGEHRYALVVAIDENGQATSLWPVHAQSSGELPRGGHASSRLQVTPGVVHIVAGFSDQPVPINSVVHREQCAGLIFQERELRPVQ